ncbi:centrosomal protein of 95 kDa-like isoform X2 [Megalops cyprinoides]|uniref:centrosomal protein of 95 kDa-like isoform X2 n=1 Tax=Megalops cyprinoides TaxID=118141 RepID=UPI001864F62B|nr:centrosomal protein of 95 kDa-like isoform X2 [Megalops cyprinoides]
MGTQEERDWVDVANDLLSKCHINLRLKKVTDCDANVFVALYEAILGEKVPDYIAAPRSQEDDVHNVQSVIDSLALDYLQISLSHITGENIVTGDKDSIKNLIEIFDGLLEYLTEQISEEESTHGAAAEPNGAAFRGAPHSAAAGTEQPGEQDEGTLRDNLSHCSSLQSTVQSSKHSLPSWSADGSESTSELIRLGDSARTFTAKHRVSRSSSDQSNGPCSAERAGGIHRTDISSSRPGLAASHSREEVDAALLPPGPDPLDLPSTSATLLREPLRSAIPLLPPYQTTPQRPDRRPHSGSHSPASVPSHRGEDEDRAPPIIAANSQSPRPLSDTIPVNGLQSPCRFLDENEGSASSQKAVSVDVDGDQAEPSSAGARRVLFRTEPDVLFLTLQSRSREGSEEDYGRSGSSRKPEHRAHRQRTGPRGGSLLGEDLHNAPLSWHRQRNRQTEEELHHMSEKLTRRLEELDSMLKRALGEGAETTDTKEEDKQSHHSDSVMECRRTKRQTGTPHTSKSSRTRSLSPSPPPPRRSPQAKAEDALARGSQHHRSSTRRRELHELESRRRLGQMVGKSYEEELKRLEERERAEIARERERAQNTEREYREAIRKEAGPRTAKPSRVFSPKTPTQQRPPRTRHLTPSRARPPPRKPAPMKVKENDFLPLLLEEFPHLQLSPHTLSRMWKQQLKQVDYLGNNQHSRHKLANQVEEAQRRHDLLAEIIRKEHEHNHRLRDFKERIQQQKSAQNKLKEQRRQIARAKKYYSDYHVQMRARMMRARTREERMLKQVFEEGLELQKARLREERAYAKEKRQEHQRRHRDELESMENYYKNQFSLLAETLAQERQEIQIRKKAQEKALQKMKRELRSKMEREIGELQKIIIQNDDDDYFWDLEVERLRGKVQMASFQHSNSHLP